MLKTLGYSMTMVIVLTTASQLSNLAALGLWGSLIDRFSNKAVLEISAPLFLACTLAWTFTGIPWVRPVTLYLLFAVQCADGHRHSRRGARFRQHRDETVASRAGDRLSGDQQRGERDLRRDRGGDRRALCRLLRRTSAHARLHLEGRRRSGHRSGARFPVLDFFFGLAFMVGLYSLHRLSFVQEASGTTDPLLVRDLLLEARRSIQSLSSAAGLLRVGRLPPWLLAPRSKVRPPGSTGRPE